MTYAEALVLLQIADFAREYPQLKALHDRVVAELTAIDWAQEAEVE